MGIGKLVFFETVYFVHLSACLAFSGAHRYLWRDCQSGLFFYILGSLFGFFFFFFFSF